MAGQLHLGQVAIAVDQPALDAYDEMPSPIAAGATKTHCPTRGLCSRCVFNGRDQYSHGHKPQPCFGHSRCSAGISFAFVIVVRAVSPFGRPNVGFGVHSVIAMMSLHDRSCTESGNQSAILLCRRSANCTRSSRGQNWVQTAKTRWEMPESIQEANVLGENDDTIDLEIVFA
jgi:hypothetical protein